MMSSSGTLEEAWREGVGLNYVFEPVGFHAVEVANFFRIRFGSVGSARFGGLERFLGVMVL
jgi:hypothetical protein